MCKLIRAATYVPRRAFLWILGIVYVRHVEHTCRERLRARYVEHTCRERLRARYVEHICSADKLISVVVIAIWLRVMTQVVFGAAGVARILSLLFRACPPIWFHVCIRICYVASCVCWGKNFWEHSCVVPSMFLVFPFDKSDCIGISCGSGCVAPLFPSAKIGCS